MKSRYSFEDRGTDRRTESISECTLKDLLNDMTRLPKLKISWRRGKQYTSHVTLGGGIIKILLDSKEMNISGELTIQF